MPKQLTRGHAAKTVTLQVPHDQLHCRTLNQVLQNAGDKARLRGNDQQGVLELQALPHRDPLIRRLFSRDKIAAERMAVRGALARAAANVTPKRLRRLGSPGRLAVLALQHASGLNRDCDIRVGQVRSAIALLAGARKKRSIINRQAKSRSAWLAQTGANVLVSDNGVRRVQLRRFCIDSAAAASLSALLTVAGDKPGTIVASMSIFRAAALSFIIEDMKAGKRDPQALVAGIRQDADSPLLRLFIVRWRRAAAAGKIAQSAFPWFDAVNWLVGALYGARPTTPGATRAPKSPRVVSPIAVALRHAQTTAPAPKQPSRHVRHRASTPVKHAAARRLPPVSLPRPGRQSVSLRMLNQLRSPTRLADTPAPQAAVRRTVSGIRARPAPSYRPAAAPISLAPMSQAERLAPTATLLDMLLQDYVASLALAASVGNDTRTELANSRGGEPAAEDSQ